MYQRIMVPLDGSELAECVLPHVESIAKGCSAPNVVFVRVVEPVHLPITAASYGGPAFTGEDAVKVRKELDERNKTAAQEYLGDIIRRSNYDGTALQAEVIMGKPADSLAEYAEKKEVDLIVMATHGRSGISRWVWGSVADKILHAACVPVLIVRAPGGMPGM